MLMHAAYVLILASFLVKDVLWLRLLSIAGGAVWVGFFATLSPVNWEGVAWNVFFSMINVWHISRLILQRRPVQLSARERSLKHLVAPELSDRHWAELLSLGEWLQTAEPLLTAHEVPKGIYLLSEGSAHATRGGETQTISSGEIIGGISYLTGSPSHEHIEVESDAQVLMWSKIELKEYLEQTPPVLSAFQRLFGLEIARHHQYGKSL